MKLKFILILLTALLGSAAAQAQSTNLAPFNIYISLTSWQAISNAWAAHQTACATSSNYVGRSVTKLLVVTNEVTGEGYQTNIVRKQNTSMPWPKWRALVAAAANTESQQVEAASRMGAVAAGYIATPIVATNNPTTSGDATP